MKPRPLSVEFVLEQPDLTWFDIKWGFDHGWLDETAVVKFAVAQLSENDDQHPKTVELAGLGSEQNLEVPSLLEELAEAERKLDVHDLNPERTWLRIILSSVFASRDALPDPLGTVEELYADFDYPPEISSFVRYMPPDDGYEPQGHTHEENTARLFSKWHEFLTSQRAL